MILVPGCSDRFSGERSGEWREASPVVIVIAFFILVAVGSRFVPGGVHDEEMPSRERMNVRVVARRG
eukprot:5177662-Heterocapsa_arctica.AAC.1